MLCSPVAKFLLESIHVNVKRLLMVMLAMVISAGGGGGKGCSMGGVQLTLVNRILNPAEEEDQVINVVCFNQYFCQKNCEKNCGRNLFFTLIVVYFDQLLGAAHSKPWSK